MRPLTIPLVTLWDYFGQQTFGMAQYFRGLQGDGRSMRFDQLFYQAKLAAYSPVTLNTVLRQFYAVKNRNLLRQLAGKPWVLGGQQFVHLIPREYLETAVVVVFDLLSLDYPNAHVSGRSYGSQKSKLEHVRYANQIITISQFSKHRIIAHFDVDPDRIKVIPLGVDREKFHPVSGQKKMELRGQLGVSKSAMVVLYVGSEQRRKNLLTLVKSLTQLAETETDFLFVKVGQPQASVSSQQFRELLGRGDLARKSLIVDYADNLADWYAIADIFVFPSVAEGFGIPVLEAMACGLPVVTTKLSSIPEVCNDSTLTVADPYDSAEWTSVISQLVVAPEKREEMGQQGRRQAARFSWDLNRKEFLKAVTGLNLD